MSLLLRCILPCLPVRMGASRVRGTRTRGRPGRARAVALPSTRLLLPPLLLLLRGG